jgi:hypothetical protein
MYLGVVNYLNIQWKSVLVRKRMMMRTNPYGEVPPAGSVGMIIHDMLYRVCYPWENFVVTRSRCGGWTIRFYSVQYNIKFQQDVMFTDEMVTQMSDQLELHLIHAIHDFRMFITKTQMESRCKQREG